MIAEHKQQVPFYSREVQSSEEELCSVSASILLWISTSLSIKQKLKLQRFSGIFTYSVAYQDR